MRQKKSFFIQTLLPIIVLAALFLLLKYGQGCQTTNVGQKPTLEVSQPSNNTHAPAQKSTSSRQNNVPKYALDVLEYVRLHGEAPPGIVGGRVFGNREKRLPAANNAGTRLKYQEWDVKKKQKGTNRGAERLITASDGAAYYTSDHYKTFTKIE